MAHPGLKGLVKEMEGIDWGTGKPFAPDAFAARPRSRSRSRGRPRSHSPSPEYNETLGWVVKSANGKRKQTNVWNADGDYGGPYADPMKLLKSKRFRDDYKDLYGKYWLVQFMKEREAEKNETEDEKKKRREAEKKEREENKKELEKKRGEYEKLTKFLDEPKKGYVVYNPADPENIELILMYDGTDWVHPIDPLGKLGGPFLTEREALANPTYRAAKGAKATAAAAASGVSLPEKVFADHIKMVPEGKRAEAQAEGYPKFTSAVAAAAKSDPTLMTDETKLATRARRALRDFLPEAAAPAQRQKAAKKGGARRTRRGRKGTRKGRKGTRRH